MRRRTILGALPPSPALAVASVPPASDTRLLALCISLHATLARIDTAGGGPEWSDNDFATWAAERNARSAAIAATAPHTLTGLRAKAQATQAMVRHFREDGLRDADERLVDALLADLIGGAA